ncbi:interleukin-1 receptor-like 1 isoform X2 [Parambassis ranga]|nr:interleukin-1 receptor-like 1 isoform X2 [Parambassis ranga]
MNPGEKTCSNHPVSIIVFDVSHRRSLNLTYGKVKNTDKKKKVLCPDPVKDTCQTFTGTFTWYKDLQFLPGEHDVELWIDMATKKDEGIYTCMCTWTHNNREYNSSGSRELIVPEEVIHKDIQILTPTDKEQFADEGSSIKLNCSIFCGINAKSKCDASWLMNGKPVSQSKGYSQSTNMVIESPSKNTISTAILTIDKVSVEDFQAEFKCVGDGFFTQKITTLTLKQRESIIPLVIGGVCVLVLCALTVVLVKWFAIDLALFFRPYCQPSSPNKDSRVYDAYVVYQTHDMDKATEDMLSEFVTKALPCVLEDKAGYRLFLHGRDAIPGEDRLELVEEYIKKSRRLIVILTPGSESEIATTQTSAMEEFDWQVGLHHALVQRDMCVILIQLGETGPQGYTHLPPGLQHLIRKSPPLKWPKGSPDALSWKSRFWKRVRYLMPATPARKYAQSSVV